MKKFLLPIFFLLTGQWVFAQVGYTANDTVKPYQGYFRPGINFDYYPPYTNENLADIAAGNPGLGLTGIGAVTTRPAMRESFTEVYGIDHLVPAFQHFANLGMGEYTMIVGFASDAHQINQNFCPDSDPQHDFCPNDFYNPDCNSEMFANMYTPIWDGGANGTPYNDDNYLAAYMYELVSTYKDDVTFWEIWNEPGFDHSFIQGWQEPGGPNNWWDEDPSPCVNHFHAPIEYFVRTLHICYDVIKTVDPDAYVALAGVGFESFLDAVLRNTDNPVDGSPTAEYPYGGGAYFDVMGFHTYPDIDGSVRHWDQNLNQFVYYRHSDAAAQGIFTRQQTYANRLAMYGYDGVTYPKKEWIITELNVPRKKFNPNSMASEETQINYIIKATAFAMKAGARTMHPFQLADRKKENKAISEFDLLGMYKNFTFTLPYDSLVKNKEGIAYGTVAKFVYKTKYDGARTAAMNLPSDLDGVALWDPANQRYKYVLWAKTTIDLSEQASGTYSFPASFGIDSLTRREWDFSETYAQTTVGPNNIQLTGRPIFLIEPSPVQSDLTATCPNDTVIIGNAEEVVLDWNPPVPNTSCPVTDVVAIQTVGPAPGTSFKFPVQELIVYQFTDDCGNLTSCSFTVTGQLQPIEYGITCPDDITITVPQGQTEAQVSWDEADVVFNTNCGSPSIIQIDGPENGSSFPLGSTQVQYMGLVIGCQDSLTLNTNCEFYVNVVPEGGGSSVLNVNCPQDTIIVGTTDEVTLTWSLPTATTTCPGGEVTITQQSGPPLGETYTQPTTVTVSYAISDSCGTMTNCSFNVVGQLEVASPEIAINCLDDITILVPQGDTVSMVTWDETAITATSNCGTPEIQQVVGPASGSNFPLGTTPVSYVAVLLCNGQVITASCSFNVTVQEIVSTGEADAFKRFTIAPNPTSDIVKINVIAKPGEYADVEVYDNLGRTLINERHSFAAGALNTTLDLSELANGAYFIRVKTPTQVGVKRIVLDK